MDLPTPASSASSVTVNGFVAWVRAVRRRSREGTVFVVIFGWSLQVWVMGPEVWGLVGVRPVSGAPRVVWGHMWFSTARASPASPWAMSGAVSVHTGPWA
ncbi:hypothetical protein GCM10009642_61970 [Nocardiopsis metallicus]